MNIYWLYLESYTMVFSETTQTLIYNTLSGAHVLISNDGEEYKLIQRLISHPDIYLLQITEKELSQMKINRFVQKLRDKFIAELIDCRLTTNKPVIPYPQLQLMSSLNNLKLDEESSVGNKIIDYLQKVTIQLTGSCPLYCIDCDYAYKQQIVCSKLFPEELSLEQIRKLLFFIKNSPTGIVDLVGGDVFSYSNFSEIICLIRLTPMIHFNLNCHQEHLLIAEESLLAILNGLSNVTLKIQNIGDVCLEQLSRILSLTNALQIEITFDFIILSGEQYDRIESICETLQMDKYEIKLLLNSKSDELVEALCLEPESILSKVFSKKDIFRRQSLNTFDFGGITVLANGDVFANVNFSSVGNIYKEDLLSILTKELSEGESWLRIRNQYPCNDCIYQWLCPSPTDYELAVGKPNLCTVKP